MSLGALIEITNTSGSLFTSYNYQYSKVEEMQDPSQLAAGQPGGGPLVFGPPAALPGSSTRFQPSTPICRTDRQRESHFHPPVHQSSALLPYLEVFVFVFTSVSTGTRRLRMRSRI